MTYWLIIELNSKNFEIWHARVARLLHLFSAMMKVEKIGFFPI